MKEHAALQLYDHVAWHNIQATDPELHATCDKQAWGQTHTLGHKPIIGLETCGNFVKPKHVLLLKPKLFGALLLGLEM